jgi:hypothetical protein
MASSSNKRRPPLQPSGLGKLLNLDCCQRYFKLHIEDGNDEHLNHEIENYPEVLGGNVVEMKSGNDFEDEVMEYVNDEITDIYDLEILTLSMAAQACPDFVYRELPLDPAVTRDDVASGDFTFEGVEASEITVPNAEETDNVDAPDKKLVEDELPVYALRVAYTESILADLINVVDTRPSQAAIAHELPRVETKRYDPVSPDARTSDDPIVVYQPSFSGYLGEWFFAGDADLILIWPPDSHDAKPRVRVVDIKLAAEEKSNHQIQAVAYSLAIQQLDALHMAEIELETGIITKNAEFQPLTPSVVPEFDRESRETDLKRLTQNDGVLDRTFQKTFDDAEYQLASKCSGCQYNEVCYGDSIENRGIELLGIDNGTQRQLRNVGIHNLEDLAGIAETIDDDNAPNAHEKPDPIDEERYNKLASIPGLGQKLPSLIQRAQALLGSINEGPRCAHTSSDAPHITNTGYGDLPNDGYIQDDGYLTGSMIRVYVNVQYDHARDCIIGLGAYVDASASTAEPQSLAHSHDAIERDTKEKDWQEIQLLNIFIDDLFRAIEVVGDGIDLSRCQKQNSPFLHFYTYTEQERTELQEALAGYTTDEETLLDAFRAKDTDKSINTFEPKKQADNVRDRFTAFRDLIGHRIGADQPMITPVLPDIKERVALKTPTTGLINVYLQFSPWDSGDQVHYTQGWEYTPDDPSHLPNGQTTVNLKNIFSYKLFSSYVPYTETHNSIQFLREDNSTTPDGWYPARVRSGAQIPLAYLWAAAGGIDMEWVEEVKEGDGSNFTIRPYMYHDNAPDYNETPITVQETEALMRKFANVLCHIERGIQTKNSIKVQS